jgi:hypothetical protein
MAQERNKKRKDVPDLTIFEEQKKAKVSAKNLLKTVKEAEEEKLKNGYKYVASADGKTMKLTKIKK